MMVSVTEQIIGISSVKLLFESVPGSIMFNSSDYIAYESERGLSVCATVMADALGRPITVQLTTQDSSASGNLDSC